jgi:hypothetical protein
MSWYHSKTLKNKGPSLRKLNTNKKLKEARSAKIIQSFMKKTTGKRQERFLQAICSDSGVCLAFGQEREKLLQYFGFTDFTYFTGQFHDLGGDSANGFVKGLTYKRNNYYAHAALKSAISKSSDNLAYEYLVGMYLNVLSKYVPCFVETYGLYRYQDLNTRDTLGNDNQLLHPLIPLKPNDFSNVCGNSSELCLLIQHLKGVKTFWKAAHKRKFSKNHAIYVLFQVYYALSIFRDVFTHYDLHTSNVLLYEPVKGGYIEYHYHYYDKKTVQFKSKYMAKIIDYGKSFYPGSTKYYQDVCKDRNCGSYCGEEFGFGNLYRNTDYEEKNSFINALHKNESHDLRLLYLCNLIPENTDEMNDLLQKVDYNLGLHPILSYGTKENLSSQGITSVKDAEVSLRELILKPENIRHNDALYDGLNKIGEFHIYNNGQHMRYKPSKNRTVSL